MPTVSIRPLRIEPSGTRGAVSLSSTRGFHTGQWRTFRPLHAERPSLCGLDCPVGTDVRKFLSLAADGDVRGAWHEILRTNPLPGVCGRVCYHPCEVRCNRHAVDEAVGIQSIERAIADEAWARGLEPEPPKSEPNTQRVAVVGGGPAGLACAYHLARHGYPVTLFDENQAPGGMLRYGIPAYRLPREALDRELELLRRTGVSFRTGTRIDSAAEAPELLGYAAWFLATGAQRSRDLRLPGRALRGIESGLDLLRDVNGGRERLFSGRAIVIGGGNTAVDAARLVLRLGAEATIVYRRSREDMPAHPDEAVEAEAEGVAFVFHASPVGFVEREGVVAGVELQRMRPGAPDASGRPEPEPVAGDRFTLPANHVLIAAGEEVELEALDRFVASAGGRFRADGWGRTGRPSIFAGGDAATGAGTVAAAIGSGRRAAEAIRAHLEGRDIVEEGSVSPVQADELNLFYFERSPRSRPVLVDPARARDSFDEIVQRLSWDEAVLESQRCVSCGVCTGCDNCFVFCPDAAITPNREDGSYQIDLTYCKGCGLCTAECPRGVMTLVPEERR
jgi:NADPH-dependent glutamate synthase beta subunit-like oxidoreductase